MAKSTQATRTDLARLIRAWLLAKRMVRDAHTRAKFLEASATLWDVERHLEDAGADLLAELDAV